MHVRVHTGEQWNYASQRSPNMLKQDNLNHRPTVLTTSTWLPACRVPADVLSCEGKSWCGRYENR